MIIRSDGTPDPCQQPALGTAIPIDVGPGDPVSDQEALQSIHSLTTGAAVPVAVIDTGASVAGVKGDNDHCFLHGTAVASVIRALAPGAEVTSIRHAPQATSAHGTVADLIWAIEAAADGGARIINISMVACSGSPDLTATIQRVIEDGALVVASTGNTGQCPPGAAPYPASVEGVLAVGAVEDPYAGRIAGQATHGATNGAPAEVAPDAGRVPAPYSAPTSVVDVFAPGGPVSAELTTHGDTRTIIGDPAPFIGTSFAAPFVSATAALAWERHPSASAAQIRALIEESAMPGGAVGDMPAPVRIVDPLAAVTVTMDAVSGNGIDTLGVSDSAEIPVAAQQVMGQPWNPPPVNATVPAVLAVVVFLVAVAALIIRARR